jgi:CHAD domain-containing protein
MTFMSSVAFALAIQPDETVQHGFVRVLGQMAIYARRLTPHGHGTRSEDVHETRVWIKRLRALLWFASPAFSSAELNPLKVHLRNASHLLAIQRDLAAVQTIVEKLLRTTANAADRMALVRMADAQKSRQAITAKPDQSLRQAVAILLATIKQLREMAEIKFRWPTASDRLAVAFLASEKAGEKALRGRKPAQFHDWRKKAKRLLYELQLTQAEPGKRMMRIINGVDKLQEKLGEYHDSVMAQDRLREVLPDQRPPRFVRHSVKLLEKGRRRLRKEVRKISRNIKSRWNQQRIVVGGCQQLG